MKKVLAAVAVAMTLPMTVMAWEPTGDVNVMLTKPVPAQTQVLVFLLPKPRSTFRKPSSFRTFPVLTARSAGQN